MELREVAEALYTADPADFVAQRNAAAGKADKTLAKDIRGLRKPSASAAAVNGLVRNHPDLIDDILAVGDRMREAFADRDRDQIRSLTAERQRLLQKALRSAGALSGAVQREVEDTLQAAVIDAAAAAAVRSGMLVRAIESTGVDQADVTDAVALPVDVDAPAPARPRKGGGSGASARSKPEAAADAEAQAAEETSRRRERQRRIRTAEKALERATADAERLDDELDEEVDRRTDLEAERDSLSRRLERTQEELSESRAAERELRRRITNAQSALRDAQKALRAARDENP